MRRLLLLGVTFLVIQKCFAPPVVHNKEPEDVEPPPNSEYNLEYERYLKEVVDALESDPDFKKKLDNSTDEYIREGKIANDLEFVNHKVRTRLDELKRIELQKLKELAQRQYDNKTHPVVSKVPEHLDHSNAHTFEVEDLKKLILKVTADLAEHDKKRRDSFKEYEMEKKYQQEEKMKVMNESDRNEFEKELNSTEEKLKHHKPVHHPISKQQLEEVWEEQDHMDPGSFDPRAFFYMHDLDGNHAWDETEVKALFIKEIDKVYSDGSLSGNDLRERVEELERMREHVFAEADTDKDDFISFEEFMIQTKKPEFNEDDGWDTVHDKPMYTEEDYRIYAAKQRAAEERRMANHIPNHPYDTNDIGHGQQYPPQYGNGHVNNEIPPYQPQYHGQVPPQQQYHGQAPPQQQYHGQAPPQQQYHGQAPPQQQYHGQAPPQQQQYHGQVPPQQQYHGQVPPQQQYLGQVPPQQQYQGQVPPQQQYQGQVPVQQQYQGQVPPQQQYHGQVPPQQQYHGQVPPQQIPQASHQQQYAQVPVQQQQHIQQPQVPVQQQQAAVPVQQNNPSNIQQQQAAVPVQQNNPTNVQQQQAAVPVQQNIPTNVQNQPAINSQSQQQVAHNEVPAQKSVEENVAAKVALVN